MSKPAGDPFIEAALSGDRSIRRLEDAASQAGQFALAKALASGDQRLIQKAGLDSEIARLERLRAAHLDNQLGLRRTVAEARMAISDAAARLDGISADLGRRQSTQGDQFAMTLQGRRFTERKAAGGGLMRLIAESGWDSKDGAVIGQIGGFELSLSAVRDLRRRPIDCVMVLHRAKPQRLEVPDEPSALGLIARLESTLARFETEQAEQEDRRIAAERRLADFEPRIGEPFEFEAELAAKRAEHDRLEAELAATATAEPTQAEIDAKTAFEQAFGVVIPFSGRPEADEDLEPSDDTLETM